MSRLATDPTLHKAMREFVIALNRAENAQSRGAEVHVIGELHNAVRDAGAAVEEALSRSGWIAPGRVVRLPQPDVTAEPTAVLSEHGVSLEF
jgi:hypothetical protein